MYRLTRIRVDLGLTKAKLARSAALDQSRLSKIESGRDHPYPGELHRLAVALGLGEDKATTLLDVVPTPPSSATLAAKP